MTGSPWPTVQYLVAFNNGPLDDPALITTVAAPGTVGAVNVWTDITAYVESHHIIRKRQHALAQFEAGTCDFVLDNTDARFNPWNTAGPYWGLLKPRKLVQVRATVGGTTYTRFTGHVNKWPIVWPDPKSAEAQMQATDAFRVFQAADITTTGYAKQVLADGAAHYWRLGEPTGSTVAADSAASNYPAVPGVTAAVGFNNAGSWAFGSTLLIPADPTSSVQVTAKAGSYLVGVQSVTNGAIAASGGVTIEWIMQVPTGFPSDATVETETSFTILGTRYLVDARYWGTTIEVRDGSTTGAVHDFTVPNLTDGLSHHVAVTLTTAWAATVYVDGVSYGTVTLGAFVAATGSPTLIGIFAGTSADATMNWQEWALYPGVLSDAQVANHASLAIIPQQSTGARVGRVLDIVGWASGARNIDTGSSNVQLVTSPLVSTSSLAHMQDCETTEAGALYMTGDGKVRFISRHTLWTDSRYRTSQATFGDNVGEIHYQPNPQLGLDDIDIYNEATGQRSGGVRQTTSNLTSIGEYGRNTWQPNGNLLGTSDAEVLGHMQAIVYTYSEPVTRLESITVDMADLVGDNQVAAVFGLELLYEVTVNRHSPPGGGTAFVQIGLVESIEEQASVDSWTITFGLDPADTAANWLVLGDATRGTIGASNVLGW